jgi:alpha-amylase/alpha-mannosidase (GH57 family)
MRPFVLHAHFYQPERLNPWTGVLDPEPSAAPHRDWNERILAECYRPNAYARIFDSQRRVERIVNNYERVSFNLGPTLLAWMEHAHPRTYAQVLAGDRAAVARTGHGNAMAQAYNHMILPLANERDRRTQIAWGLADYRHRFGRDAEGLWLPEAAVDSASVDALIDAGVGFTVLAPHQAAQPVDTGRTYRLEHSDGSGRDLAVLFYDGELAQGLAFDPATMDAAVLLGRLEEAAGRTDGLVHAALDGETFGHHHTFGELGLAYALFAAAAERGLEPTNYAAFLADHPPTETVQVADGEGTAWSCAHGVGRWYRDCGCATDAQPGWNQAWRTPLREALDVVRDAGVKVFEERGGELLADPWAARDAYIDVRLGTVAPAVFLDRHARHPLSDDEAVDAWTLLEAQRHAMVMYTSCGWFFGDVAGIETVYVLRSAARVVELLGEVGGSDLAEEVTASVLDVLAHAQSNRAGVGTGADIWRERVVVDAVTPVRVAATVALHGLVSPAAEGAVDAPGHVVTLQRPRAEKRGRLGLATTRLEVSSKSTGRRHRYAVAAVHLGGTDFHGIVAADPGDERFTAIETVLWEAFPTAPIARLLRLVDTELGAQGDVEEFGLDQVLPAGRQELVGVVFADLADRFHTEYSRLYHDHRRILEMLTASGYELPLALRAAGEVTLSMELAAQLEEARAPQRPLFNGASSFEAVRDTVDRARQLGFHLDLHPVVDALTDAVTAAVKAAVDAPDEAAVAEVERWLALCAEVGVDIDLSAAQERAWDLLAADGPVSAPVARLAAALAFSPGLWERG